MTDCKTCKHCTPDETERCYRCVNDIEDNIITILNKLKGNCGCDYHKNNIISECINKVHNYFSELKKGE